MNREEQFLRQAVRGLSRRGRREALAELRSHLYERRSQLEAAGYSSATASHQALQELGPPQEIARGLREQDQVSPLLSAAALSSLTALACLPVWLLSAPSNLQPSDLSAAELRQAGYLPLHELATQLDQAGVALEQDGGTWMLRHPALREQAVLEEGAGCQSPVAPQTGEALLPGRTGFANPATVLSCAAGVGWPLQLSASAVSLQGQTLWSTSADRQNWQEVQTSLYFPAIRHGLEQWPASFWDAGFADLPQATVLPLATDGTTSTIQVSASGPLLYLVRTQTTDARPIFLAQVVWPDQAGEVQLRTQFPDLPTRAKPIYLTAQLNEWLGVKVEEQAAILLPLSAQVNQDIVWEPLDFANHANSD